MKDRQMWRTQALPTTFTPATVCRRVERRKMFAKKLAALALMVAGISLPRAAWAQGDLSPAVPSISYESLGGSLSLTDGIFSYNTVDVTLGEGGDIPKLTLARTSPAAGSMSSVSPFGFGSSSNLHSYLIENVDDAETTVVFMGRTYKFWGTKTSGDDMYGLGARLNFSGTTGWDFYSPDGIKATFFQAGSCGRACVFAKRFTFPNGVTWTFTYDWIFFASYPADLPQLYALRSVESSNGYGMTFNFVTEGPHTNVVENLRRTVQRVDGYSYTCTSPGVGCSKTILQTVSYSYTTLSNPNGYPIGTAIPSPENGGSYVLSTVMDRSGATQGYTYSARASNNCPASASGAGSAHCIISAEQRPGGIASPFTLDFSRSGGTWTFTQQTADGNAKTLTNRSCAPSGCWGTKLHIPGEGDYLYDFKFGPDLSIIALTRTEDPLGRVEQFNYDIDGRLIGSTAADGSSEVLTLDSRGNVLNSVKHAKPGSGAASLTRTATYPVCTTTNRTICNRPEMVSDYRGYYTKYTYDLNAGEPATVRKGLDASGNCVLAGGCPITQHTYAPFTGTDGTTFYLETQRVEQIDATRTVTTTYEYDASNHFVLKGSVTTADGVSLRRCTTHDAVGNKISETTPRAALGVCP